jgi:hypothetical protein
MEQFGWVPLVARYISQLMGWTLDDLIFAWWAFIFFGIL